MAKTTQRIIYLDILNIMACLWVVLLHHNGIVHDFSSVSLNAWTQALFIEVVCYFAVPIFLMLTGVTLMEYRKRYDTKTFFQKRLSRVLVPFITWMIIFFLYDVWQGHYDLSTMSAKEIFDIFLFNRMMAIYWFFPVIISIYFAVPILSLLTEPKHRTWLWYMVGVGSIFYGILPATFKMLHLDWNPAYTFPLTGGGLIIYPILGYLLSTTAIPRRWRFLLYGGAILCIILRFVVMYHNSIASGSTDTTLAGYVYFTAMIPAAAIFILAQRIPWQKFIGDKSSTFLAKVSGCSLGVYLIHMFVIMRLQEVFGWSGIWFRTAGAFLTYFICLAIVWVVKSGVISRRLFP